MMKEMASKKWRARNGEQEMASKDIFGEKVNPKVWKEEPCKSR